MKKLLALGGLTLTLLYANIANASIIPPLVVDFRDSAWADANGDNPFSHENIIAEALIKDEKSGSVLYQDSKDGLGIMGSGCGYENDEIDSCEALKVSFEPQSYLISEVVISDLFASPDGIHASSGEYGALQYRTFSGGDTWFKKEFWGINSDQANGEQVVSLGVELDLKDIVFFVPKNIDSQEDEFSVIGFTGVKVPEPAPLVILGLAIIGLATIRRK